MACPHPIILRPLASYGAIRLLDSSIYSVLLTIRISAKTERGPPRMSDFSALLNKYRVKVFLSHSASDLREKANWASLADYKEFIVESVYRYART